MAKNPKLAKNKGKEPKAAQNSPKCPRITKNGPKWSKNKSGVQYKKLQKDSNWQKLAK